MEDWIECKDFIEADVIRFGDAIWERKGPKGRQKSYKVGARDITAEVIDIFKDKEGVWVVLKIVRCIVVDDQTGGRMERMIKVGEEIKRLKTSLIKWGKPQRLPWSDEDNRARRFEEHQGPSLKRARRN